MPYPPLSLIKRLTLGIKVTPAQEDQNLTDIETGVNTQAAQLAVALNPNGTIKNNAVATAALQDRCVTQNKLSFASAFYADDVGAANAMLINWPIPLTAYATPLAFYVKAVATNTGATTIQVDLLPPVNVMRFSGTTLGSPAAGEIVAGNIYCLVYDGVQFILLNPTPGSVATGPVLLAAGPQTIYAFSGPPFAWTTTAGALLSGYGVPVNAKAIILQCRSRWNTAGGGECVTEMRKDSLSPTFMLNRCGGVDADVCMNQGIYPVLTPALTFDYRLTSTSALIGETEIMLCGYYL